MSGIHDWPGRAHVETLRQWPELVRVAEAVEARPDLYRGALLAGSLSRGEGDAISDIDVMPVVKTDHWAAAWNERHVLSAGAIATFDRLEEGKPRVGGHGWLTPSMIKVECLMSEPGAMRLAGKTVVLVGPHDLADRYEHMPAFTRQAVDDYAEHLRATGAISDIERAYGDLISLLRKELRS